MNAKTLRTMKTSIDTIPTKVPVRFFLIFFFIVPVLKNLVGIKPYFSIFVVDDFSGSKTTKPETEITSTVKGHRLRLYLSTTNTP